MKCRQVRLIGPEKGKVRISAGRLVGPANSWERGVVVIIADQDRKKVRGRWR